MPKNKLGGNKAKRAKASTENNKKELEFKEDGQDEKGDIITKYTAEEARSLKNYGELPENVKINETDIGDGDDSEDGVEFDEAAG
ncbi:EIF1AY [Symbiodinium sp. KB8]|nr:EIF1AY [Symbiodinium sp. KB8]